MTKPNHPAIGEFENSRENRWGEIPIAPKDAAEGRISVVIANLKPTSNAVVSILRFVAAQPEI